MALRTCVDARVSYCAAWIVYPTECIQVPDIPLFLSPYPERCPCRGFENLVGNQISVASPVVLVPVLLCRCCPS